jgi:hypothetical protein
MTLSVWLPSDIIFSEPHHGQPNNRMEPTAVVPCIEFSAVFMVFVIRAMTHAERWAYQAVINADMFFSSKACRLAQPFTSAGMLFASSHLRYSPSQSWHPPIFAWKYFASDSWSFRQVWQLLSEQSGCRRTGMPNQPPGPTALALSVWMSVFI